MARYTDTQVSHLYEKSYLAINTILITSITHHQMADVIKLVINSKLVQKKGIKVVFIVVLLRLTCRWETHYTSK